MQHVYHLEPIIAPAAQGYRHPYKIGGCGCLGATTPAVEAPTSNKNMYIGLSLGALALAVILGVKFVQDTKK